MEFPKKRSHLRVVKKSGSLQKYQFELPLVWWAGDEINVIEIVE